MMELTRDEESLVRMATHMSDRHPPAVLIWAGWVGGMGVVVGSLAMILDDPASLQAWGVGLLLLGWAGMTISYVSLHYRALRLINKLSSNPDS